MSDLPMSVQSLMAYRATDNAEAQALISGDLNVRWDLLADSAKGPIAWKAIARHMGPQALRMNLNTLLRHDVFKNGNGTDQAMIDYVAERISNVEAIRRSRQFPYQFLSAYLHVAVELPQQIQSALHQAAEIACGNVPELPGPVLIGLDTSGSMGCPVTGYRGRGGTTRMRCIDVAALFAAAILRRNPDSVVIPFDTQPYKTRVDPQDTILSLSERLAQYGGGGTDCSIPLRQANTKYRKRQFAGCVLVSDNESWITKGRSFGYGHRGSTGVMTEWQTFVNNQKRLGITDPKLVCIDIQPYGSSQAPNETTSLTSAASVTLYLKWCHRFCLLTKTVSYRKSNRWHYKRRMEVPFEQSGGAFLSRDRRTKAHCQYSLFRSRPTRLCLFRGPKY